MLKIAAVLMTTTGFAGLLVSGPSGLAVKDVAPAGQIATVKVRTIAIHVPVRTARINHSAGTVGLLDPNPLYVPVVDGGARSDLHNV